MISVHFDSPGPFAAGESISGQVVWQCEKDTKVQGVSIVLAWYTEGRGDKNSGIAQRMDYKKTHEINRGRKLTFPFWMSIPDCGPISYDGVLIRVQWRLRVAIDIPWAIDLKHDEDIQIVAKGSRHILESPTAKYL